MKKYRAIVVVYKFLDIEAENIIDAMDKSNTICRSIIDIKESRPKVRDIFSTEEISEDDLNKYCDRLTI